MEKEFFPFCKGNMSSLLKPPRVEKPIFCPMLSFVDMAKQVPVSISDSMVKDSVNKN